MSSVRFLAPVNTISWHFVGKGAALRPGAGSVVAGGVNAAHTMTRTMTFTRFRGNDLPPHVVSLHASVSP
jgi:hypothetical protein